MLVATAPLYAPSEDLSAATFALRTLARVRFLTVESLLSIAGPFGFRPEFIHDWQRAGLVYRGTVTADAVGRRALDYLALTTLGARALESTTGEHVVGLGLPTLKRASQKRAHSVCAADAMATFLALDALGALPVRGIELDERKIASSVVVTAADGTPERIALQPDGYALVQTARGLSGVLLELDMATTACARFAKKLAAYLAWQRDHKGPLREFSVAAMRVVVLTTTIRHAARLHDATLRACAGTRSNFILFGCMSDVSPRAPERVFDPILRPLGAELEDRVPLFRRIDNRVV